MAQYIKTSDEFIVLQNPTTLQDLLNSVTERHPSVAAMMMSMWILINGVPAKPTAPLKDGDEVDLIPLVAGG